MRPRMLIGAAAGAAAADAVAADAVAARSDLGSMLPGNTLRLDARQSHHLVRVLRLGAGAPVECFDGHGTRIHAHIETADAKACVLRIDEHVASDTESPLQITLAQCVSGADRMDWTIEKAVELGVHAIQPLSSQRSQVRLDAERAARRAEHWSRIIEAACMQCGRDRLPRLWPLMTLPRWLEGSAADSRIANRAASDNSTFAPSPLDLVLDPTATQPLSALAVDRQRPLRLLVGPESGLTDEELAAARAAGFTPVRLGPRVLRTETAGLAALAALQMRAGDF